MEEEFYLTPKMEKSFDNIDRIMRETKASMVAMQEAMKASVADLQNRLQSRSRNKSHTSDTSHQEPKLGKEHGDRSSNTRHHRPCDKPSPSQSLTKSQKESRTNSHSQELQKESRTVPHSRKKPREEVGMLAEKDKRGKMEKEKWPTLENEKRSKLEKEKEKRKETRTGLDEVRTKLRQRHRRGRSRTVRRCRNSKSKGSTPTSSGFLASTRAHSYQLIPSVKEIDPEEEVNQPSEISSDNIEGSEILKRDILTGDMCYANILNLKPLIDFVPELGLGVPMKGLNQIDGFLIDGVTPIKNIQDRSEIGFTVNWKIYTNRFLMSDHEINPAIFQLALISGEHARQTPSICISLQEGGVGLDYRFDDFAVANSYSVARSPSARSIVLVNGIYKDFVRSYIDSSIFQHQQQKWNVPGSFNMLTVGKEILLEVQSTIQVWKSGAENTSCYLLISYPEPLVLTTLSNDDLVDNFNYADLKGNPNTLSSGCSSWSYFRKGEVISYYSGGWSSKNADHDGRNYYAMMGKDQGISRVSILEELPLMTCHMSETTENRELGLYPEARATSKWKMEQRVMSEDQYQPEQNHRNSIIAWKGEELVLFLLEAVRRKIQIMKFKILKFERYWEGRGARKKKKQKILAFSYHPP